MNLGFSEMVFIFFLALVIFGPKRLPEIGRQVGKALAEFKRATNEFKAQLETEMRQIEVEETLRKEKEKEKEGEAQAPTILPEAQAPAILPTVAGVAENSVDAVGVTSVDPLSHPYAADTSPGAEMRETQTTPEPIMAVPDAPPEWADAGPNLAAMPSPEAPAVSEPGTQSIPRSAAFSAESPSAAAVSPTAGALPAASEAGAPPVPIFSPTAPEPGAMGTPFSPTAPEPGAMGTPLPKSDDWVKGPDA